MRTFLQKKIIFLESRIDKNVRLENTTEPEKEQSAMSDPFQQDIEGAAIHTAESQTQRSRNTFSAHSHSLRIVVTCSRVARLS